MAADTPVLTPEQIAEQWIPHSYLSSGQDCVFASHDPRCVRCALDQSIESLRAALAETRRERDELNVRLEFTQQRLFGADMAFDAEQARAKAAESRLALLEGERDRLKAIALEAIDGWEDQQAMPDDGPAKLRERLAARAATEGA